MPRSRIAPAERLRVTVCHEHHSLATIAHKSREIPPTQSVYVLRQRSLNDARSKQLCVFAYLDAMSRVPAGQGGGLHQSHVLVDSGESWETPLSENEIYPPTRMISDTFFSTK